MEQHPTHSMNRDMKTEKYHARRDLENVRALAEASTHSSIRPPYLVLVDRSGRAKDELKASESPVSCDRLAVTEARKKKDEFFSMNIRTRTSRWI
jgi:hypothetical protein